MKRIVLGLVALLLLPGLSFAQSLNPTPGVASVPNISERTALAILANQTNPSTRWTYVAATGGITDTTAVTIKAAAGAGKKLYISAMQFSNSGAGTSEFVVNCGAAGTALYRGFVQATQPTTEIRFPVPLQCTANTLLEVKLGTGTTMAFRFNAQGYSD